MLKWIGQWRLIEKNKNCTVSTYSARLEESVGVVVVKVYKSQYEVDTRILRSTDSHPNILRFYGAEDQGPEFK